MYPIQNRMALYLKQYNTGWNRTPETSENLVRIPMHRNKHNDIYMTVYSRHDGLYDPIPANVQYREIHDDGL